MKVGARFFSDGGFKLFIIAIMMVAILASVSLQSCGATEETKMSRLNLINQAEAVKIADNFVQTNYKDDLYIKDKANPSSVTDEGDIWVIFYEDKDLVRLPSGLELAIDKKTGKIWRRNQE